MTELIYIGTVIVIFILIYIWSRGGLAGKVSDVILKAVSLAASGIFLLVLIGTICAVIYYFVVR